MNRLKRHCHTLQILQKAPASVRKNIIEKGSAELIRCVCDCALNILSGRVTLSKHHKHKLKKHKAVLRQLVDKKISLEKKRKITQKGGFLPALIGALAPVLGGIISSFTK